MTDCLISIRDVKVPHHERDEGEQDRNRYRLGHHQNKEHEQLRRALIAALLAGAGYRPA